jgi:enoyl-CoA hydratase/carnithine racemase
MTETPGLPTLALEGHRATIRLNRPAVHNRIEPPDIVEMLRLMDRVDADPDLRVLVLAAGGKSFSSGFHIQAIGADRDDTTAGFDAMADRMERMRLPTIAALNGGVYGGATDLALACDLRIGVAGMALRMPAAALGLHYYTGGMQRYVSRLGLDTAKRLFLLAERIEAEELLRIGFLTELVAPEALAATVEARATALAGHAPLAVQGMKRALNDIARGDADLKAIAARAASVGRSEDLAEGRRAWTEKRKPAFKGK